MLCISQEGLKEIKVKHGDRILLRKSNATSTSPFPVRVTVYNETDNPGLQHYDQLERLKVTITISNLALQDSVQRLEDVVSLQLVAPELPASLTRKMQNTLAHTLNGQHVTELPTVEIVLSTIGRLAENLSSILPDLLTLIPKCMEQYQSIGPSGDTQRRIKFNNRHTAAQCCASADSLESKVEHCDGSSSKRDIRMDAAVPTAIARAMKQLGTRFPDFKTSPAISHVSCTATSPVPFTVSLLPSDPTWEHGELSMSGNIALIDHRSVSPSMCGGPQQSSASYTAFDSHCPSAHATSACDLRQARKPVTAPQAIGQGTAAVLRLEPGELTDAAACAIVNQMLRRQAQVHAGVHNTSRLAFYLFAVCY